MQIADLTTRQKVITVIFVLIVIFLIWQVIRLLHVGGSTSAPTPAANAVAANTPQMSVPKPAALPKPADVSANDAVLQRMQQQTEAQYVVALNELQMLKISRDIAEANKAIATAKLDTVTAQKNTLDL